MFLNEDITVPNCRGLVFPDGDIAGTSSQNGFRRVDVGLSPFSQIFHRQCRVVLAAPVLFFAVVASVVCPRRRVIFLRRAVVMVEKVRLFKDHRTVELIVSSPDPSTYKRIGQGVRNVTSAV